MKLKEIVNNIEKENKINNKYFKYLQFISENFPNFDFDSFSWKNREIYYKTKERILNEN